MADKSCTCCRGAKQHDGFEQSLHAAGHDSYRQPNAHDATHGHAQEHAPNEHVRHYVISLCQLQATAFGAHCALHSRLIFRSSLKVCGFHNADQMWFAVLKPGKARLLQHCLESHAHACFLTYLEACCRLVSASPSSSTASKLVLL